MITSKYLYFNFFFRKCVWIRSDSLHKMDNGGGLGAHVGGLGGHGGGLGSHGGGLGSHDGGSSHGIGGHSSSCDIVGGGAGGQPPNFSSSLR